MIMAFIVVPPRRHGVPGTIFKEGLSWRTHQVDTSPQHHKISTKAVTSPNKIHFLTLQWYILPKADRCVKKKEKEKSW